MTRQLNKSDSDRIRCQRGRFGDPACTNQATVAETVDWNTGNTRGTSFFYFCDDCYPKQIKTAQRKIEMEQPKGVDICYKCGTVQIYGTMRDLTEIDFDILCDCCYAKQTQTAHKPSTRRETAQEAK